MKKPIYLTSGLIVLFLIGCGSFDAKHEQLIEEINAGVPANVLTVKVNDLEKSSNGSEYQKKIIETYRDSIVAMDYLPEGLTTNLRSIYNVKGSSFRIRVGPNDFEYLIRWSKGKGPGNDINPGFRLHETRNNRDTDPSKMEKERLTMAAILKKYPESFTVKKESDDVQEWHFSRNLPEYLWSEAAKKE